MKRVWSVRGDFKKKKKGGGGVCNQMRTLTGHAADGDSGRRDRKSARERQTQMYTENGKEIS